MDDVNTNKPKKGLYIVIAIIVIVVLGLILKKSNNNTIPESEIQRGADGSITYENNQGKATVGGDSLPANWPSDAPKYANAKIQYSGENNPQTGEEGSAVVFTTSDGIQTVVDFYKKELVSNGWTVEQTATVGANTVIAAKKDTRSFGIYIVDAGDGQVSVTAGISFGK